MCVFPIILTLSMKISQQAISRQTRAEIDAGMDRLIDETMSPVIQRLMSRTHPDKLLYAKPPKA